MYVQVYDLRKVLQANNSKNIYQIKKLFIKKL